MHTSSMTLLVIFQDSNLWSTLGSTKESSVLYSCSNQTYSVTPQPKKCFCIIGHFRCLSSFSGKEKKEEEKEEVRGIIWTCSVVKGV